MFVLAEILNHKTSVQKWEADFSEIILETSKVFRVISWKDNAINMPRWKIIVWLAGLTSFSFLIAVELKEREKGSGARGGGRKII